MPLDAETLPVIIGVGRYTQPRGTPLAQSDTPISIMARTSRMAAADSGLGQPLLDAVDTVAVVQSMTEARSRRPLPVGADTEISHNWPRSLARAVGAGSAARHLQTHDGGNSSQMLVNAIADKISAKESRLALLSGCEVLHTLLQAIAHGEEGAARLRALWSDANPQPAAERIGPDYRTSPIENRHGLMVPVRTYPLLEQSFRAETGKTVEEHMAAQSALFAGFSDVAAEQPEHAWFATRRSAEEIATPSSDGNRYVGFPYTKYHCAVMNVDQSASVIVASLGEARRRGVSAEKLVYLHGCADTVEKEALKRSIA